MAAARLGSLRVSGSSIRSRVSRPYPEADDAKAIADLEPRLGTALCGTVTRRFGLMIAWPL